MVFNFADDSKNIVFRKGSSSVDYISEEYYLYFRNQYSNMYMTNSLSLFQPLWEGGIFYIKLTKVDDNDEYVSFSWDRNNINSFGQPLPSEINKEDISGYYILELRATNSFFIITNPIATELCKVINDWSNTSYDVNKATRPQEEGAEFIYYRG